jgi:ribonucleoside-diphosphate reductase alpha chain
MKRTDLGQVKPDDLLSTATRGEGGDEEHPAKGGKEKPAHSHVVHGKDGHDHNSHGTGGYHARGQTAPQALTPQARVNTAELPAEPELPARLASGAELPPAQNEAFKIVQARIKGYEGDPCPACGSFTLVRNGTCMKCDTCGGTTGCS